MKTEQKICINCTISAGIYKMYRQFCLLPVQPGLCPSPVIDADEQMEYSNTVTGNTPG